MPPDQRVRAGSAREPPLRDRLHWPAHAPHEVSLRNAEFEFHRLRTPETADMPKHDPLGGSSTRP